MAKEDREEVQRAEKVTLKRKLTGPPRLLLLGKTRTRTAGEDRPEDKNKAGDSGKSLVAAESETAELTQTANVDAGASSEVHVESSRGRCGAAGEDDDVRNRKVNRRRWWRRFSSAVVCNRKPRKDVKEILVERNNDGSAPPEEVLQEVLQEELQEADAAGGHKTEDKTTGTKGKTRFNLRTWPMFRRFLTLSNVKDCDEASTAFRKKMHKFSTKDRKSRSSGVPLESMEDTTKCEEALSSCAARVDEPTQSHHDLTAGSVEAVTVSAEISLQLTEKRVCDISVSEEGLTDSGNRSETTQTGEEVVESPEDTKDGSVKDFMELESPEKNEVFGVSSRVVLDAAELLSASTSSSPQVHCEDETDETTSHPLQPTINGPSIRIELVPPDDVAQEDGEEECCEGSSSSENHLLLLLLGFERSEQRLLQTARSLVRAAMNAAVDQLTREEQSKSDCVLREPPGCRDHA